MKPAMTNPDWPMRKLRDVADVVRGSSPRPAGDPRFFSGDYLPWITVGDITRDEHMYLCRTESKLTEAGAERTRILEPGTVILTNSGATLGVPKINNLTAGANDGIAAFLNIEEVLLPDYLYVFLQAHTDYFREKVASGVGQPNLNTDLIGNVDISLPPRDHQRVIIGIHRTWNDAIVLTNDLVTIKLRFKQGLMQQLLTGKRRLPEFRKPWQEYLLGQLFDERDEPNRVDLPLLSITADRGLIPRNEIDRKDSSSKDKSLYKRITPGDLGYNTMRMWQGVSAVSRLEGIVSPAYTICVPKPAIDPDFAGYLFKYPPIVHLFHRFSQGLVSDTLSLKFHHFAQIHVSIPCVGEQRKIVSVLQNVDHELDLLRKQLDALKEQKKGLMQKLLTGQVRIGA